MGPTLVITAEKPKSSYDLVYLLLNNTLNMYALVVKRLRMPHRVPTQRTFVVGALVWM